MKEQKYTFLFGYYQKDSSLVYRKYFDSDIDIKINELKLQNKRLSKFLAHVETTEFTEKVLRSTKELSKMIKNGEIQSSDFEFDKELPTPKTTNNYDIVSNDGGINLFTGGWNWLNDHWEYIRVLTIN